MSLLDAKEAAARLKVSARKVYAAAASGELACYRFGSAVRFDPADLDAWKAQCRSPATTRAAVALQADPVGHAELSPLVRYFGLDSPKVTPLPQPILTPSEVRRAKREAKRLRELEHRALLVFHATKRRAAKLQRTPPWADLDAMRALYAQAQEMTAATGVVHHVDHIIPLQGKTVSGLHVPGNLQILTGSENSRKRNSYEVEA